MRKYLFASLIILLIANPTAEASIHVYTTSFEILEHLRGDLTYRSRFVSWDRAIGLTSDNGTNETFTRHRTSFALNWYSIKNVRLYAKLTNEFRYFFTPKNSDFTINEIFVDEFNVFFPNLFNEHLRVRIGRQNIKFGDGFVVMDGTPLDDSRSDYFNAISLKWRPWFRHIFEGFVSTTNRTDDLLPVINSQDYRLVEKPERGYGLNYYLPSLNRYYRQNLYYIGKSVCFDCEQSERSSIHTFGTKLDFRLRYSIEAKLEGAYQFGSKGGDDRSAFGGHGQIEKYLRWGRKHLLLPDLLGLGAVFLSGDDPNTAKYEGWDPVFGRWPQWSESYIYTLSRENGVAWWTNFLSLNLSAHFNFRWVPHIGLKVNYHRLFAPEAPILEANPDPAVQQFPGGDGHDRGQLFTAKIDINLNHTGLLKGQILFEHFIPGDFYSDSTESYNWFRVELKYGN